MGEIDRGRIRIPGKGSVDLFVGEEEAFKDFRQEKSMIRFFLFIKLLWATLSKWTEGKEGPNKGDC